MLNKPYYPDGVDLNKVVAAGFDRFIQKWRTGWPIRQACYYNGKCWKNQNDLPQFGSSKGHEITNSTGGTATSIWANMEGQVAVNASQACHGGIQHSMPNDKYGPFVLLSPFQSSNYTVDREAGYVKHTPERIRYYQWLLNESPWCDTFITKDPVQALDLGVGQRLDFHNQLVIGGAIAYRHGWEQYPFVHKVWFPLVESGMNPNLAFLIGQTLRNDGRSENLEYTHVFTGHMAVHHNYETVEAYLNFVVKGNNFVTNTEHFCVRKGYYGVNDYWYREGGRGEGTTPFDIEEFLRNVLKQDEDKDRVSNNVFQRLRELRGNQRCYGEVGPPIMFKRAQLPELARKCNKFFGVESDHDADEGGDHCVAA